MNYMNHMNYVNNLSGNRLIPPLESAREMFIADSQFNFDTGPYAAPAIALLVLINGTWTL